MKAAALALFAALAGATAHAAPGEERWTAMSHTATAITGDIVLSPLALRTRRATFPLKVARDVPAFRDGSGVAAARVLRVTRPANPVLLNGNRLCGGSGVRWIVVWRENGGEELTLAAFSSPGLPTGTDGPGLCGTYGYMR